MAAAAAVTGSEPLQGAAWGMVTHFARDLAVGSGVPLLWPLSRRSLRIPYAPYGVGCAVLAFAPAYSRSRSL